MYQYNFTQIVFFFLFYCIFGWVFESTYCSIKEKKFTNRGFMRGPFIPIYGCGAMMLLVSSSAFLKWPVAVFFAGMISCSVLEYCTGWAMEKIFKVRYWDYSPNPLNLNGYICLGASLAWGALSILLNYWLHKPVKALAFMIPPKILLAIVILVSIYFIVSLTLAIRAAIDLRNIIIKLTAAKEEMRLMSRRLDVLIAVVNDEYGKKKQELGDAWDDISGSIEERMDAIKKAIESKPSEIAESVKAEYYEMRAKLNIGKNYDEIGKRADLRSMIKNNPTMKSSKFADSFEALKKGISEKIRK